MSRSAESQGRKLTRSEHYRIACEQDKRWISKLDVIKLNNVLWPLFVAFICLNFLDIYTTSIALSTPHIFFEKNVLAAKLFASSFLGFILALAIKFAPAIPLFYAVFLGDSQRYQYQVRVVKLGALAALIAGVAFYCLVVLANNIPVLLYGTLAR